MTDAATDGKPGRDQRRRIVARTFGALALVGVGALGATVVLRHVGSSPPAPPGASAPVREASGPAPVQSVVSVQDVVVALPPDAVARLKLKTAIVARATLQRTISVPATVMPNAYREVKVTPIATGIVTRLHAELGTPVVSGAPLATIFSVELADAQTKFLSMAAMLEADHRKLERTRELVTIGAASRQELEEVEAVHATHETETAAARQRLLLLGLTPPQVDGLTNPSQIVSTVVVPAPIDGIITARSANTGQVVSPGQEIFVVTDLSTLWVVGEVYERDFAAVRAGAPARITTAAYPNLTLHGKVGYIDPRVDAQSRTGKMRIEVPDSGGRLKLGMYVTVEVGAGEAKPRLFVPRAAVQTLGERQVVFLALKSEEGRYLQRVVQLGPLEGDRYPVIHGVTAGEEVVTDGSFFLRAESLRNAPGG